MEILCPFHPLEEIDRYLSLTDWFLMEKVLERKDSRSTKERRLGKKVRKEVG
jgi:hypothetical protein